MDSNVHQGAVRAETATEPARDTGGPSRLGADGERLDPARSETTRYLCAGAHLERGFRSQPGRAFRRRVIERVLENECRAIGVSPGVDLVPVVQNCLAAIKRKIIRDGLLAGLLVVFLASLGRSPLLADGSLLLAYATVLVEMWISTHQVIARRLARGSTEPMDYGRSAYPNIDERLDDIRAQQEGNITVYSGFSPFVGAGVDVGGWSFAVNAARGKEEMGSTLTPKPFSVTELYDYVLAHVAELGLTGLRIEDRLCANGKELRGDPRFFGEPAGRPRVQGDATLLAAFVEDSTETVRHYKCIRVIGWRGELVLSIFLRCSLVKGRLFVEASYFLLPPLKDVYREVDAIPATPTWRQKARLMRQAAAAAPMVWITSPLAVLEFFLTPLGRYQRRMQVRREMASNPTFDYGATTSIREDEQSPSFRQYFQRLDKEMYVKIIEKEIFDSIVVFLEAKNIDTSDLKERQTTVLNSGVIVSGGSIQAESLAVGEKARSMARRMTGAASPQAPASSPGNVARQ